MIFSFIWSLLISTFIFSFKSKMRIYIYAILDIFWLFFVFAQLMMLKTKDSFITIYDLNLVSEALDYIEFIFPNITLNICLFFVFMLFMFFIIILSLNKTKKSRIIISLHKKYIILTTVIIFILGWSLSINLYTVSDDKYAYYAYEYEKTFYDEISDPIRTLELTGVYHYFYLNVKVFQNKL